LCVSLLTLAVALPAHAADTLDKIRETKTITIGNREAARPFSYVENGQPTGYSIELCKRVADAVKKELKIPDLKVNYHTVSGAERLPKLQDGSIDLECGSTTNTVARQEKVDFSYTIFVAGMKILSTDPALKSPESLRGKKVGLSKGTTSEKLFTQLHDSVFKDIQLVVYPNNAEAFKALQSGAVAAFPQDDVLLSGMVAGQPDAQKFKLSSNYLSVEPYGIMVRKGDARLLAIVDRTLQQIYDSGEINTIYGRWFDTATMKFPMSGLLRDAILRPGKDAGFARELGYTL
jgi:glutamate/aspartate transport system substrate-binding protein